LIGALIFFPIGAFQAHSSIFSLSILPLGLLIALLTSAVPYSLEMVAMTKLPAKTFGTLMSMEPAMAALSGIIFLGEFLTGTQWLALAAIIAASAGSTLTIQRKTKLESVDVPCPPRDCQVSLSSYCRAAAVGRHALFAGRRVAG